MLYWKHRVIFHLSKPIRSTYLSRDGSTRPSYQNFHPTKEKAFTVAIRGYLWTFNPWSVATMQDPSIRWRDLRCLWDAAVDSIGAVLKNLKYPLGYLYGSFTEQTKLVRACFYNAIRANASAYEVMSSMITWIWCLDTALNASLGTLQPQGKLMQLPSFSGSTVILTVCQLFSASLECLRIEKERLISSKLDLEATVYSMSFNRFARSHNKNSWCVCHFSDSKTVSVSVSHDSSRSRGVYFIAVWTHDVNLIRYWGN